MRARGDTNPLAAKVAANVRALREARKLSAERLSQLVPAGPGHMSRSMISNLELGYRQDVTVDQLAALAAALGIADPWDLVRAAVCNTCAGSPPPGFACIDCDAFTRKD
jgi:transcriptional regulator with XRE-family HTH domain